MFLMDRFFNGAFLTFGLEVIAFAERDQVQGSFLLEEYLYIMTNYRRTDWIP